MKRYDERILNRLLDRYEKSLLYTGQNRVNISISVKLTRGVVPEYYDQTGTEYALIDEQLRSLEKVGMIRLVWGKTNRHIIESCELNTDHAAAAYKLLKRMPKSDKQARLYELVRDIESSACSGTVRAYAAYTAQRLEQGKSVRAEASLDDPEEFRTICRLIDAIEANKDECFMRELSVRTFHDSKTAGRYISKAVGVLRRYSERVRALSAAPDMSNEAILEEFYIYQNPTWIMLKGCGRIRIGDAVVDLSDMPMGIGTAGADARRLTWERGGSLRRVLTIENLTSFHRWKDTRHDTLGIYLGGYADRYKRALLRSLYEVYPDAEYAHFGDIDCGGFCIWKALCEDTGIPFATTGMDMKTYLECCDEGRALTENDRRRLEAMKEDEFFCGQRELFELMLKLGVKTEQESIGC